jgi:Fungal Zn(2)-Cys(6) binuclear cluster domain
MQHSRPPNFPLLFPSFKTHRSSLDASRFAVHLTLPKPTAVPVWASLPTPPMSGSPPPEQHFEPPQIAGRRRKRSETPPTTTAPTAASPPTPLEHSSQVASSQARTGSLEGDASAQQGAYLSSYPPPPVTYGSAVPMGVLSGTPPEVSYGPDVSPRAVRKTKAHVASACVNCKKKHLRCDNARPCKRCVQSGKEVIICSESATSLLTQIGYLSRC